jgi:hypothetical protein
MMLITHFPSDTVEAIGHIFGISNICGHTLTYKVLNPSTLKVIHRSLICPADILDYNLRVESLGGESEDAIIPIIHSHHDDTLPDSKQPNTQDTVEPTRTHIINPEELMGCTFLMDK